ncbi:MAG: TetR/AcrR family transcriptional regulator, partial [Fervidobacterium sp.]
MSEKARENKTKEKILQASKKLFSEKGFEGVSMEDIAQASGVRKSLIYYYFPSKEVLFEEVWINVIDELESEIFSETENEGSITKVIKRIIKKYIEFAVKGSKRMREIIIELLNFSKADEFTEEKTKIDLNLLLNDILILHQKKIEE